MRNRKSKIDYSEQNDEGILESLGNLEINDLDNIVSIADNVAMKLAI